MVDDHGRVARGVVLRGARLDTVPGKTRRRVCPDVRVVIRGAGVLRVAARLMGGSPMRDGHCERESDQGERQRGCDRSDGRSHSPSDPTVSEKGKAPVEPAPLASESRQTPNRHQESVSKSGKYPRPVFSQIDIQDVLVASHGDGGAGLHVRR